jgi:hypothetical protein
MSLRAPEESPTICHRLVTESARDRPRSRRRPRPFNFEDEHEDDDD